METLFDHQGTGGDREGSRPGGTGAHGGEPEIAAGEPLAARVRPRTLAEFVGQGHLLGEGSTLRTAIEQGKVHSMILHGPPGTGKTTLARMVAHGADAAFEELSAVAAGRSEVREVLARAAHRREVGGRRTVFFLDEIHRFNKAQQDALLPAVEEGLVVLIGATTENPAFEVNGALLSRLRVYALVALTEQEISTVLARALSLRADGPQVDGDAVAFLAARCGGDARSALNALALAIDTAHEQGRPRVDLAAMEDALGRRAILYDKGGDRHYDYISAWIKATRGSDPDASLYYLAAMLQGGEDARFIVRRMVILASEDIGNADPQALVLATAAAAAVEHVGMPEARYALAQTAIYLALAPKSDAAGRALAAGQRFVSEHGVGEVPPWLVAGPRPGLETGGYDNPHGHPGHLSSQELFPEGTGAPRLYQPDDSEATLRDRLKQIAERRERGR